MRTPWRVAFTTGSTASLELALGLATHAFDHPMMGPVSIGVVLAVGLGYADFDRSITHKIIYVARSFRDICLRWLKIAGVLVMLCYLARWTPRLPHDFVRALLLLTPLAVWLGFLAGDLVAAAIDRRHVRRAVLVGANTQGRKLVHALKTARGPNFHFIGYFEDRERDPWADPDTPPHLGGLADLVDYLRTHKVDEVYFAIARATDDGFREVLDTLQDTTCSVHYAPDLLTFNLTHMRVDEVDGIPVIAVCDTPTTGFGASFKRLFDIVGALLAITLFAPVLVGCTLAVAGTSRGPVIFRQRRYGLDGHEIVVWKFRTMTVCEDGEQIRQATDNDPRITRVGAFLRRTSLDELPQLFNVLGGAMSLVGPRPHAVAHNEYYRRLIRGYMLRHKTKPGITGLAQVRGLRGETETVEKMADRVMADLEYLRNWSLGLDFLILLRTVATVLGRRNAW